ncbi:hypothetical protein [Nocardia sp. NBC_00511]|uniref:hypothetical protein n=1 Tax=Nocardia sp. NBC_00511 TaxID=2903591 RepID=UPI0030DE6D9F
MTDSDSVRFIDSSAARRISLIVWVGGSVALLAASVLYILTLVRSMAPPHDVFVPIMVLVFPLFCWSFFVTTRYTGLGRRPLGELPMAWRALTAAVPRPAAVALIAFTLAGAVLAFITLNTDLPAGQPQYDSVHNTYGLNIHGTVQVIDHSTYLTAVAQENRLFLAVYMVFLPVAVLGALFHRLRTRPTPAIGDTAVDTA